VVGIDFSVQNYIAVERDVYNVYKYAHIIWGRLNHKGAEMAIFMILRYYYLGKELFKTKIMSYEMLHDSQKSPRYHNFSFFLVK